MGAGNGHRNCAPVGLRVVILCVCVLVYNRCLYVWKAIIKCAAALYLHKKTEKYKHETKNIPRLFKKKI